MKALVYTGERRIELADAADPLPREGEVRVRVEAVGICGSDMHAFLGHDARRPPPLILGHEAAGIVLDGPLAGRRVAVNPLVACGTCRACREGRDNLCPSREIISMPPREGAFAEIVSIPPANLVAVPGGIDPARAALTEPLACGWHAVRLAAAALHPPLAAAATLVLGGGAIGVGAALCLLAQGVSRVEIGEPNARRRERLAAIPGLVPRDPAAADGAPATFDLVIDAVGFAATRAAASAAARPGGVIAHIGLGEARDGLDVRRMTLQEITFIGTYTYTAADFRETADAIFSGRLGPLDWIEERPLDAGPAAFDDILGARAAAPRIVLTP